MLKGQITPKSIMHIFFLRAVLFIHLDCSGVSCLVLEISVVGMSSFFRIP